MGPRIDTAGSVFGVVTLFKQSRPRPDRSHVTMPSNIAPLIGVNDTKSNTHRGKQSLCWHNQKNSSKALYWQNFVPYCTKFIPIYTFDILHLCKHPTHHSNLTQAVRKQIQSTLLNAFKTNTAPVEVTNSKPNSHFEPVAITHLPKTPGDVQIINRHVPNTGALGQLPINAYYSRTINNKL